jgi:hypothetical protein
MIKLCECGCGQAVSFAPHTDPKKGWVKGQPLRFVNGHHTKGKVLQRVDPAIRFWKKVDKNGPIHPVLGTACWVWTGYKMPFGHGQLTISKDESCVLTHRFSWELHHGPIPEGIKVCHRCDNPPCVRPDHLFLGTQKDNIQDAIKKGRPGYLDWKRKPK